MLEARHLHRRHPDGQRWLLEDISLEIQAGQRLVLAGPSGSGKTLLLRSLALLDPLDSGEIRWHGTVIRGEAVPAYRCRAIYLHQRPALLEPTVEEAIRKPFSLGVHRDRNYDRARVISLLTQLGRDAAFLGKAVRDLSGGEIQIASLLRALQLDPNVLFLDEPTAALDPKTASATETMIVRWVEELPADRALVWVSHDAAQTARVGQTRLQIQAGKLQTG